MSPLEASIRDLIASYVLREISSGKLNDELPDPWALDEANDFGATDLAIRTVGALADFHGGDLSEEQFRAALMGLLRHVHTNYGDVPISIRTGATTEVVPLSFGFAAAGKAAATESVS